MNPFYAFYDRSYGYTRAIITFVLGIVLIIWPDVAVKTIIIILGALIMAAGIASLVISYKGKWKQEKVPLVTLNGLVDIIFGLVLILFPTFFAGIIMFLFGLLLLFFGISAIISLLHTRKSTKFSMSFYIGPIITTICGVIVFFNPFSTVNWLFIFFGISLLIYSLSEFVSTGAIRRALKKV